MAYQNVKIPRFYINDISYAINSGYGADNIPLWFTLYNTADSLQSSYPAEYGHQFRRILVDDNPNNRFSWIKSINSIRETIFRYKTFNRRENPPNYVALLNHDLASKKIMVKHNYGKINLTEEELSDFNDSNIKPELGQEWETSSIVNAESSNSLLYNNSDSDNWGTPNKDGFSIYEITNGATADGYNGLHSFNFTISDDDFYGMEQMVKIIFLHLILDVYS